MHALCNLMVPLAGSRRISRPNTYLYPAVLCITHRRPFVSVFGASYRRLADTVGAVRVDRTELHPLGIAELSSCAPSRSTPRRLGNIIKPAQGTCTKLNAAFEAKQQHVVRKFAQKDRYG